MEFEFKLLRYKTGWRSNLGRAFQKKVKTIEWKAALIVFEKYKRKLNLQHTDLLQLKDKIEKISEDRKFNSKAVNQDILVQEASRLIKEQHATV